MIISTIHDAIIIDKITKEDIASLEAMLSFCRFNNVKAEALIHQLIIQGKAITVKEIDEL